MDKNIPEFMKLSRFSEIKMTVNGETHKYRFSENPKEDGFELYAIDSGKRNGVYGLSCRSISEVINTLIHDYYKGIITDVTCVAYTSPPNQLNKRDLDTLISCLKLMKMHWRDIDSAINTLEELKTCHLNEKEIQEKAILDYTKWCYIHGIDFSYMGTKKTGAQFCEDVITRYKEDKNIEQEEYERDYE